MPDEPPKPKRTGSWRWKPGDYQSILIKHARIARALCSIRLPAAQFYILNRLATPELPEASVSSLAAELEWKIEEVRVEVDAMRKRGWVIEHGQRHTLVAVLSLTQEGWKTLYLSVAHTEKPMPNSIHYLKFDTTFNQHAPAWVKLKKRRREFKLTMGFDGKAWNNEGAKFPGAMGRKRTKKSQRKPNKARIMVPTHDQATRTILSGGGDPERVEQETRAEIRALR